MTASAATHAGFDHAPVHLAASTCRFEPLADRQGVHVTLDGPATFNYVAGIFYHSSPHVETLFWQCAHSCPPRRLLPRLRNRALRMACGGGDVLVHTIRSYGNFHDRAETVTLRAGLNRRVYEHPITKGLGVWFLHKSYICSSADVEIRSVRCNLSRAAAARSLYVLQAKLQSKSKGPGVLYLSGMTDVECIELRPGEGIRINQGHVIGATANLDYICEPITTAHVTERGFLQVFKLKQRKRKQRQAMARTQPGFYVQLSRAWHHVKVLTDSVLTAEGLYSYSVRNNSPEPACLLLQLDRPFVPDSPGVLGLIVRYVCYLTRLAKLPRLLGGLG
jgi:hypothetical protein